MNTKDRAAALRAELKPAGFKVTLHKRAAGEYLVVQSETLMDRDHMARKAAKHFPEARCASYGLLKFTFKLEASE